MFYNVKIFEHRYPFYSEKRRIVEMYYWAKHVGLIRKEVFKYDEEWIPVDTMIKNLIRYNVKPYKQ